MFHAQDVPTGAIQDVPVLSPSEIVTLLNEQDAYFHSGQTLSLRSRLARLTQLFDALKRHEGALLAALHKDLRKHKTEAYMTEIGLLYTEIREAQRKLKSWMRPQKVKTPLTLKPAQSRILKEPLGRVLIVSPWNYPIQLALTPLIGAIAAGNVAVLKPSELSPASSAALQALIEEIYPHDFCRVLQGGVDLSRQLLERRWDHIFFTGSTSVGRFVATAAAQHLTPCVLELGGKSPCLVTAQADITLAARRIVFGKFMNAGQTCVAPDYILVEGSVHDALVAALKREIELRFGKNPLLNPQLPKIINARHFQRLSQLLHPEAIAHGGQTDPAQLLIAPTLLTNVTAEDPVMQEEIFGPLLPILKVNNLSAALNFVVEREKPLGLYLFSKSKAEQELILSRASFGGGCINDTIVHAGNSHLPFGGVGPSGMGGYHGEHSFNCFSHKKAVLKNPTWTDMPLRYHPWSGIKDRVFRFLMS